MEPRKSTPALRRRKPAPALRGYSKCTAPFLRRSAVPAGIMRPTPRYLFAKLLVGLTRLRQPHKMPLRRLRLVHYLDVRHVAVFSGLEWCTLDQHHASWRLRSTSQVRRWFGEIPRHLDEIDQILKDADVLLVIGTSSVVCQPLALGRISTSLIHFSPRFILRPDLHHAPNNLVVKLLFSTSKRAAVITTRIFCFLGPCEDTLKQVFSTES